MTGGAAAEGRELRAGAELAVEIANNVMPVDMDMAKRGGITSLKGAKIELIFKDHEGNPTLGADLAKKLILDDKVVGILGCYNSAVTKTVSAVCEQYGIPMINDSSTSPALTQRDFKWFWRTTPHDVTFTRDLFELLKGLTEGKVKGVAAVPKAQLTRLASACEKTEFGSQVSETIDMFAKQYGFEVLKSILYAPKSVDLSSEVRSLQAAKPDVMLFASYTSDAILMVKTLKSQKARARIIWGQDAGFEAPEFRSRPWRRCGRNTHPYGFRPEDCGGKAGSRPGKQFIQAALRSRAERRLGEGIHRSPDLGRGAPESGLDKA